MAYDSRCRTEAPTRDDDGSTGRVHLPLVVDSLELQGSVVDGAVLESDPTTGSVDSSSGSTRDRGDVLRTPLSWCRTYEGLDQDDHGVGPGWATELGARVVGRSDGTG